MPIRSAQSVTSLFYTEGGRVGRYLTVYKYKPALESCRLDRLFPRGVPGPRERASKDTMH